MDIMEAFNEWVPSICETLLWNSDLSLADWMAIDLPLADDIRGRWKHATVDSSSSLGLALWPQQNIAADEHLIISVF